MRNKFYVLLIALILPACVAPQKLDSSSHNNQPTYYDSITIEVVYTERSKPSDAALNFLTENLRKINISRKIVIISRQISHPPVVPWTSALIRQFESQHRLLKEDTPKDRNLILFIAYLPDFYLEGTRTSIAGLQYEASSFAIFIANLKKKYEGSVLLHEFGHIINLVRLKPRKEEPINPDRPRHCNNNKCVMFWKVSGVDRKFDDACLGDIKKAITARN